MMNDALRASALEIRMRTYDSSKREERISVIRAEVEASQEREKAMSDQYALLAKEREVRERRLVRRGKREISEIAAERSRRAAVEFARFKAASDSYWEYREARGSAGAAFLTTGSCFSVESEISKQTRLAERREDAGPSLPGIEQDFDGYWGSIPVSPDTVEVENPVYGEEEEVESEFGSMSGMFEFSGYTGGE